METDYMYMYTLYGYGKMKFQGTKDIFGLSLTAFYHTYTGQSFRQELNDTGVAQT